MTARCGRIFFPFTSRLLRPQKRFIILDRQKRRGKQNRASPPPHAVSQITRRIHAEKLHGREMYSALLCKEAFLELKKTVKAYDERIAKNLDKCNKEMLARLIYPVVVSLRIWTADRVALGFFHETYFVLCGQYDTELMAQYRKWADYQFTWQKCRQASIKEMQFPFPYREGQKTGTGAFIFFRSWYVPLISSMVTATLCTDCSVIIPSARPSTIISYSPAS